LESYGGQDRESCFVFKGNDFLKLCNVMWERFFLYCLFLFFFDQWCFWCFWCFDGGFFAWFHWLFFLIRQKAVPERSVFLFLFLFCSPAGHPCKYRVLIALCL